MSDTLSLCRDTTCPSCGYFETYLEVPTIDGAPNFDAPRCVGCRSCLWRTEVSPESLKTTTIVTKLTRAQRAAYKHLRDDELTFIAKHGRYAVSDTGVSVSRRTLVNLVRRGVAGTFTTEHGALGYRYLPPRERVNL